MSPSFQPHSPKPIFKPFFKEPPKYKANLKTSSEQPKTQVPDNQPKEPTQQEDRQDNARQLAREVKRRQALEERVAALETQLKEALESSQKEQDLINRLADALEKARADASKSIKNGFADTILTYTKRLINGIAPTSNAIFRGRLENVMEHLILENNVTVHVSSNNIELAKKMIGNREGWTVVGDDSIGQGCKADCRSGFVDASLEAAYEALEDGVKEWLMLTGGEA